MDEKWFPEGLRGLRDCPKELYFRGDWDPKLFVKTMAVVGSRRVSRYGEDSVDILIPHLVSNNIVVVSGFMYGVDTMAHTKCIRCGGKTIAVLGSGLDSPAPISNDHLYSRILDTGGIVISEFEASFPAARWTFPRRNRIVAALATEGILIIEAGIKSGSLITAKYGKVLNKKVYAVSGPMGSVYFEGNSYLIKTGQAEIITKPEDIFGDNQTGQIDWISQLDRNQRMLIEAIDKGNNYLDSLVRELGWDVDVVATEVTRLSIKGLLYEKGGTLGLIRKPK